MTSDEREIFQFLKSWGHDFVTAREIARRASTKKRFHADPNWAKPFLISMTERHILESDVNGRYRIKPKPRQKKGNKWVSPEIAKILKESGVEVEDSANASNIAEDEYYEQL